MSFSDQLKSPLGWIRITADDKSVTRVQLGAKPDKETRPNRVTAKARREIEEYFSGKRETFSLPYSLEGTDFQKKVWRELGRIPYGQLICYAELARRIGHARAIRAVGTALGKNPLPILLPCHRIVRAGNRIGGFTGGLDKKRCLLRHEGSLATIRH